MREEIIYRNPMELLVHPQNAFYFDALTENAYLQLKRSIEVDGVLEAALVTQDDIIVSGSNRKAICMELGKMLPTRVKIYEGDRRNDIILRHLIVSNVVKRGGNCLGDHPIKQARRIVTLEELYGIHNGGKHGESALNVDEVTLANCQSDFSEFSELDISISTQAELAELLNMDVSTLHRYKRITELSPELQEMVETNRLSVAAVNYLHRFSPDDRLRLVALFSANESITTKKLREAADEMAKAHEQERRKLIVSFDAERQQSARKLETAVKKVHDMEKAGMRYKRDADDLRAQKLASDRALERERDIRNQLTRDYEERCKSANRRADAANNMSAKNIAHSAQLEEELEALRQVQTTPAGELLQTNSVTTLDHSLRMLIMHYNDPENLQLDVPREHLCSLQGTLYSSVEMIECLIRVIENTTSGGTPC